MIIEMKNYPLVGVNLEMLQEFWGKYMQCGGPDLFRISMFEDNTETLIMNGVLPNRPNDEYDLAAKQELAKQTIELRDVMQRHFPTAQNIVKRVYHFRRYASEDHRIYALYGQCRRGILAIGWMNDGDMDKAAIMCSFVYHLMGLINAHDDVLYESAVKRLPFRAEEKTDFALARRFYDKYYLKLDIDL